MDAFTKRAFVLMPSGLKGEYDGAKEESDFVFSDIILPAFAKVYGETFPVTREVDTRTTGAITRHLVQHIAEADICIVDVTGLNPNVFFELGIRYGLRRATTILMKQSNTVIPFDIANYRWVEYSPKYSGIKKSVDALADVLQSAKERRPQVPDSLVFEVYPNLEIKIPGVEQERPEYGEASRIMDWSEYWQRLKHVVARLQKPFKNGRYVPDALLGISNGGLAYADFLVRELFTGVPVLSLWANRVNNEGKFFDNPINNAIVSGIKAFIARPKEPKPPKPTKPTRKVELLLVDDIVASGNTVQQAVQYLRAHIPNAELRFLPLFSRNQKYIDANPELKKLILWSVPLFGVEDEKLMALHASDRDFLPYGKDLRST